MAIVFVLSKYNSIPSIKLPTGIALLEIMSVSPGEMLLVVKPEAESVEDMNEA